MPFRSQAQWRWAFANKKPWADDWAKHTPKKMSDLPLKVTKARTTGNFDATAGQKIGGNQCRDANGHFVNCDDVNSEQGYLDPMTAQQAGSSMAAYEQASEIAKLRENERKRAMREQYRNAMGLGSTRGGAAKISPEERKRQAREEQKKNESTTHGAVGPGAALGSALSNFADPDNPGMLPNLTANRLQELGLVEVSPRTGKPFITGEGRAYINAARSGDQFAAREAMQRAQEAAISKREAELQQAQQQAFQQQLDMIQGTPEQMKLQAAQDRANRRAQAAQPKAKRPPRETNNTYGSGKVTVGSPKNSGKSFDGPNDVIIPNHVLVEMIAGMSAADELGIDHPSIYYAEKAIAGAPLTFDELQDMRAWHTSLKSVKDNEDPMTAEWVVYQMLGSQGGLDWIDSVMMSYTMAMSSYKSNRDINRKPSLSMSINAIRGLDLQETHKRGGSDNVISVGEKIANRRNLSDDEIQSLLDRANQYAEERRKNWANPSNPSSEYIDFMILGGVDSIAWAKEKLRKINRQKSRMKAEQPKINRVPSVTTAGNAIRGLDLQHTHKRGGSGEMLLLGARIANRNELSDEDIRAMHSYLHRHMGDRTADWANPSDPSAAYINWMIHGGDDGLDWSSERVDQMRLKREKPSYKGRRDSLMRRNPASSMQAAASDYVFPNEKRFPITDHASVTEALNSWPQYHGLSKYEDFKKNLSAIAVRKDLVKALPRAWQKGLDTQTETVEKERLKHRPGGKDHNQQDHAWNTGTGRGGSGGSGASFSRRRNARQAISAGVASDAASSSVSRVLSQASSNNSIFNRRGNRSRQQNQAWNRAGASSSQSRRFDAPSTITQPRDSASTSASRVLGNLPSGTPSYSPRSRPSGRQQDQAWNRTSERPSRPISASDIAANASSGRLMNRQGGYPSPMNLPENAPFVNEYRKSYNDGFQFERNVSDQEASRRNRIAWEKPLSDRDMGRLNNAVKAYEAASSGTEAAFVVLRHMADKLGVNVEDMADMNDRLREADREKLEMSPNEYQHYDDQREYDAQEEDYRHWAAVMQPEVDKMMEKNGGPLLTDDNDIRSIQKLMAQLQGPNRRTNVAFAGNVNLNKLMEYAAMTGMSLMQIWELISPAPSKIASQRAYRTPAVQNARKNQAKSPIEDHGYALKYKQRKSHDGGKDSFSPPAGVQSAAKRGLELRSKFGRGGTAVGIARARDLSNGKSVSASTIRRMNSFFARHAVDKRPGWSNPSKPSNGYIAHLLWGGDAGRSWASKVSRHLDATTKEYPPYVFNSHIDIYRHRNDESLRKEQQRHRMQYSIKGRRKAVMATFETRNQQTTKGKNAPNDPALWKRAIAAAKKKYDVYPSAYANGYASSWYKKHGGTWQSATKENDLHFLNGDLYNALTVRTPRQQRRGKKGGAGIVSTIVNM